MLKRQRPPSPPSFLPSIPLVDEYPDAARDVKRRRILPPSLDGKSRGWENPDSPDDDDDEGYILHHENSAQSHAASAGTSSANYKQTNTVLQEMHTLNQHRLLFASYASGSQASTHSHCMTPSAQSNHDAVPAKMLKASHPEVSGGDYSGSSHSNCHLSTELQRVAQRYGDVNRLLGSLFLSRRRQLGNSEEAI